MFVRLSKVSNLIDLVLNFIFGRETNEPEPSHLVQTSNDPYLTNEKVYRNSLKTGSVLKASLHPCTVGLSNDEVFKTPTSEPPKEQGDFTIPSCNNSIQLKSIRVKNPCSFGGSLVGVSKTS